MQPFENEQITITKIHTVEKYIDKDVQNEEFGTVFCTYELIFFLRGNNITTIGKSVMRDEAGTVRYIPKGEFDGRYTVEKFAPGECIDIYFDTESPMPQYALAAKPKSDLKDKFFKLYKVWQRKDSGYYAAAMMLFYDIIYTLQNESQEYLSPQKKEYMQKSYDYILNNYKLHNFDYDELCKISGLKYTYFNELFKKTYGMTPVRLVTKLKIDYAKELLVTGRYSVAEISEMCGFANTYYFSTVFKKQTGFAPSKYPLR